jgi:hypothetical protein
MHHHILAPPDSHAPRTPDSAYLTSYTTLSELTRRHRVYTTHIHPLHQHLHYSFYTLQPRRPNDLRPHPTAPHYTLHIIPTPSIALHLFPRPPSVFGALRRTSYSVYIHMMHYTDTYTDIDPHPRVHPCIQPVHKSATLSRGAHGLACYFFLGFSSFWITIFFIYLCSFFS